MTPEDTKNKAMTKEEALDRVPMIVVDGNEWLLYDEVKRAMDAYATSLYKHLQENGRVAELEKECERLKGILEKIIRTTRFYLPNLSSGEAWQQFKTENNL